MLGERAAGRQRGYVGPVAEAHPNHSGQPAQAPTQPATWAALSCSYFRRLGPASAGFLGNRLGSPLRGQHGRVLHPQPGGHRRLHRLDRSHSSAGQGAILGGSRTGGNRQDSCPSPSSASTPTTTACSSTTPSPGTVLSEASSSPVPEPTGRMIRLGLSRRMAR